MFHVDDIDLRDYPSREEEAYNSRCEEDAIWESRHACHHGNAIKGTKCQADADDTLQCGGCDLYHCAAHLTGGFCADCNAYSAADIAASAAAELAAPLAEAFTGWLAAVNTARTNAQQSADLAAEALAAVRAA